MRYISAFAFFALLTISAAGVFGQLKTAEKADSNSINNCFPKALVIAPSEKTDFLIILEPSEKNDSKMLIEVLCPGETQNNQAEENLLPPISLISPNKKP